MPASGTGLAPLWSRLRLRRCAAVGSSPSVTGRIWIHGAGRIVVGDRARLDASAAPIELYAGPGAAILIGDDVEIAGGASIEASASVVIGDRCRIGAFAKVLDNHFHPLRGDRNVRPPSAPVVVEEDVAIGPRAIVLAGARLRRHVVVSPGAVVRGPRPGAGVAVPQPRSELERPSPRPFRAIVAAPGDTAGAARRLMAVLRARWLFRRCQRGARLYASGRVRVVNEGRIAIGERAAFLGGMIPTELASHPGALLEIGARSVLNYGASIDAHSSIRLGRRCMVASSVRICDRGPEGIAAIDIGDDVWIAHGATICPGVTIGAGSVVSAGSVVTRDVPPHSLAAGSPARHLSLGLVAPAADPTTGAGA